MIALLFALLINFGEAQNPVTECAKKKNCCDCAATTQFACTWDTNVARKRQANACVPNAAKKRSVDDAQSVEEALQAGFVLTPNMCPCGDGNKCTAASEECDDGKKNGTPESCCTAQCKRKPDNTVCATKLTSLSADQTVNYLCDADDVCKSGVCTATVVAASANQVCRAAKDVCDIAEVCNGVSQHCGTDRKQGSATVCRPSTADCDQPEVCDGTNAACPPDRVYGAGRVCRAAKATELCDDSEKCDGTSRDCPPDNLKGAGAVCRAANGPCDVEEVCDGSSKTCPVDGYKGVNTVCKVASGVCDVDDVCSGQSVVCAAKYKSGDVCRPAVGVCDVEEKCNGQFADCPNDQKYGTAKRCRDANGACDRAENCNGSSNDCPPDNFLTAGTMCRSSAGKCDIEEKCTGVDAECPIDAYRQSGTVCDAGSGCLDDSVCSGDKATCGARPLKVVGAACKHNNFCYIETTCDASGVCQGGRSTCQCEADSECKAPNVCAVPKCDKSKGICTYAPAARGTMCRAAVSNCDAEEVCDGINTECPVDGYKSKTTVCRPAAGVCDVEEYCTGFGFVCPPNQFYGEEKICKEATSPCMIAGRCSGTAECPVTGMRQVAELCDDGDKCTTKDKCTADGKCVGTFMCECRKGSDCYPKKNANDTMGIEEPCMEYNCVENKCVVTPRASCEVVGACALGTGGCACKLDKTCDAGIFGFTCNKTSGFCESSGAGSKCIKGSPGCPCMDQTCMAVARKRGFYLRCVDDMCRIEERADKPSVACRAGEEGCTCADGATPCDAGLKCTEGFCAADCLAGTPGCTCRRAGSKLCLDEKAACMNNRCVFYAEDCDKTCTRGDPGCCCKADNTCTEVQRRKRADAPAAASGNFIYVNTCNKDKICTVDAIPDSGKNAAKPKCGTHLVGDAYMNAAGVPCHCTESGEICDSKNCLGLVTKIECQQQAENCGWGKVASQTVEACFNRKDFKELPAIGALNGPCTTGGKICDDGKCDVNTLTCVVGDSMTDVQSTRTDSFAFNVVVLSSQAVIVSALVLML